MQAKGLDMGTIENLAREKGYSLPRQTDILEKVGSVFNKIFPGKQVGQTIGTLGGYGYTAAKEALGFVPKGTTSAYDLSSPTPLQLGGDIAQGAAMVAGAKIPGATSILGKAAQFGALGAVSGGGAALAEGKSVQEAGKASGKSAAVGALTGLTFGIIEKGIRGISAGIGKTGEKIQYSVIKPSQADIKDGFNINTLKEFNLGGSLQDTLQKTDSTMDDLTRQLNEKLASNNTSINLNSVYDRTAKNIFGDKFAGVGSNLQMSNSVENLRNELIYAAGSNGLISIPEAQVVKRAAGHYGAWQYGMVSPEANANQRVYNVFYTELKNEIENSSPTGVREINQKLSRLIPVMNAVIRRIPVAQRNQALSLTDIITLTGATLDPRALGLTALNLASKSGTVGNVLSKATGVGQGISQGVQGVEQLVKTYQQSGR
jgi:hypothetical protein